MIEGGSHLLQSVIDAGAWDEARIITSNNKIGEADILSPKISSDNLYNKIELVNDKIEFYLKTIRKL